MPVNNKEETKYYGGSNQGFYFIIEGNIFDGYIILDKKAPIITKQIFVKFAMFSTALIIAIKVYTDPGLK